VSERQSRPVDYGSADDGFLDEEAPDLGPLREAAEAAELAEAMSGLTASFGGPFSVHDPLRSLACAVARVAGRVPRHSGGYERHARSCAGCAGVSRWRRSALAGRIP
jgi:hypothetical protein